MWFLSALSGSFALHGSWVTIVEMFISKGDSRGERMDVHWDVRLVSRQIIFFSRLVSDDTQELFLLSLFGLYESKAAWGW
jgi:hypothetical protein